MIANDTYMLDGTREELAVVLRCRVSDLTDALPNLKSSGVGDVTIASNGRVTLESRRLKREQTDRKNAAVRVTRYRNKRRCNGDSSSVSVSASDPGGIPKGAEPPVGFVEVHAPVPVLSPGSGLAFTVLKGEIGKAYDRSAIAHWTYEEEHLLAHLCRTPTAESEWLEILAYHRKDPRYKRQSVLSLLSNWASELDKARNYDKNHKGTDSQGRSSRNAGTYNEGRASQYARAAISGKNDVPKLPDVQ